MRTCSICDAKHYCLGYCHKHYARFKKWGDPHTLRRLRGVTGRELLETNKSIDPETGCWNWTGYVTVYGYGPAQSRNVAWFANVARIRSGFGDRSQSDHS
jgi:hypothetical protein